MTFSKEKKRQLRLEAAQKRKSDAARLQAVAPPNKALKAPPQPKNVGVNTIDYGGHYKALNFPLQKGCFTEVRLCYQQPKNHSNYPSTEAMNDEITEVVLKKMGDLSIGLCYEGDWKAKSRIAGNGKRLFCLDSEKWMSFLKEIEREISPILHPTLRIVIDETMRVNVLCGAVTLAHTDSFRGNTPNLLYIVWEKGIDPGWLVYDLFPRFKVSVVTIDGNYYVPHSYSQASDELRCVGENPNKPGHPYYFVFPSSFIDKCQPVGDLPYGIVGWKANGDIQVVPEFEEVCVYKSPLIFQTYKWDRIIADAKQNPSQKPRKRLVALNKTNTWMSFKAYVYRHWWVGNNMVTRYHVFFRSVRQTPTSSNIIRNGERVNYIDMKSPHCKRVSFNK